MSGTKELENKMSPSKDSRLMPYWRTYGLGLKEGPIEYSEIQYPSPWPPNRRIPGKTLPMAGRFRFIKISKCGTLNLYDKPPVLSLKQILEREADMRGNAESKISVSKENDKDAKAKGKDAKAKGKDAKAKGKDVKAKDKDAKEKGKGSKEKAKDSKKNTKGAKGKKK